MKETGSIKAQIVPLVNWQVSVILARAFALSLKCVHVERRGEKEFVRCADGF